jgi:hypothetical protein
MFEPPSPSGIAVGRQTLSVGRAIMARVTTLYDVTTARSEQTLGIEDGR